MGSIIGYILLHVLFMMNVLMMFFSYLFSVKERGQMYSIIQCGISSVKILGLIPR